MFPSEKSLPPDPKAPQTPLKDKEKDGGQPTPPAYAAATSSSSSAFQTRFASVSLHMTDRLRFLNVPMPVVDKCRAAIVAAWPRGIQAERLYGGSLEIKVHGYPWQGLRGEDSIWARRLVCAVLRTLHDEGWLLTLSTDVSKKNSDKDTMLFRHQIPSPTECEWSCIAFSRSDRIEFIDLPTETVNAILARLGPSRYQSGHVHYPGAYELKMNGVSWWANGEATMRVRELLLMLLEVLECEGWTVYASIDQKNGQDNNTETDTWHCCKPKAWSRGTPVYHN